MHRIRFDEPVELDHLEAQGAFFVATYKLAVAYGVSGAKLVNALRNTAEYKVNDLAEELEKALSKKEDTPAKGTVDDPIDLDAVLF